MRNELYFANLLLDQAKDIVFCSNYKSDLLYVNNAACQALKYSRAELLSMSLQDLEVNFLPETWSEQWHRLQENGSLNLEHQYRTKLGEIVLVKTLITFTTYQNQHLGCFFSKAEIKLDSQNNCSISNEPKYQNHQSQINLNQKLEPSSKVDLPIEKTAGVIALNTQGKIISVNRQFLQMWGLENSELVGESCERYRTNFESKLKQPNQFALLNWQTTEGKQDEENSLFELKDGRIFAQNSVPQILEDQTIGRIYSIRDVTEKSLKQSSQLSPNQTTKNGKVAEKPESSNDFKKQFLSMFCHQVRSSLNIISFSNSLLKRSLLPEIKQADTMSDLVQKSHSYFNNIQVEVEEINQLINDFIFYGEASIGEIAFQPVAIDLNLFCKEIVSRMQAMAINKQQIISFFSCCDSQSIRLDSKLLQIVLTNLLSNAVRYSPEKSNIEFKLCQGTDTVLFEIKDYGIGIPTGDRAKIFQPFYRASNAGNVQGNGIGLAIVKNLVEVQKGTIELTSELDKGTTFTVSLPSQ